MSDANEVKLCLKVMVNKQKTKVLFAEIDSNFADVLLSFLTLPLGKIVGILKKHYGEEAPVKFGSLTTLYDGLANIESNHFWTEGCKDMLLNPRSSFEAECLKLKLDIGDTQPTRFFGCADTDCKKKRSNVSMYYGKIECDCGKLLSKPMGITTHEDEDKDEDEEEDEDDDGKDDDVDVDDGGVFTGKKSSFLLTDDLKMAPSIQGSVIQTLISLGVEVPQGAEFLTVTVGFNEIIELLRASIFSETPLTDVVLRQTKTMGCSTVDSLHHKKLESPSISKKTMTVKAMVKKSTNKLLFFQAEEDFVDFLFSLLTIPLGGVEYLLDSNTSLRNIDNLYTSITELINDKYMSSPCTRTRLIKPELPPKYLSKNQIFPLTEQTTPTIYYFESGTVAEKCYRMCFKDPKGEESYIKGPGKYIVTRDLYVISCKTIGRSIMKHTTSSDVKAVKLQIGFEEVYFDYIIQFFLLSLFFYML
ncbi:hypothetical protein MIMGU_mgv1a018387mg [Erythranthe guttata]|uniref:DUF674 domain-containing protein n=1 Tax=Erythranthe guttata TaxID=4155 RepID=A0A022QWC8_ERYGU|nr:hypothetical protein MIMGU_mgv1a018387mg [Erythranthe guttata]